MFGKTQHHIYASINLFLCHIGLDIHMLRVRAGTVFYNFPRIRYIVLASCLFSIRAGIVFMAVPCVRPVLSLPPFCTALRPVITQKSGRPVVRG